MLKKKRKKEIHTVVCQKWWECWDCRCTLSSSTNKGLTLLMLSFLLWERKSSSSVDVPGFAFLEWQCYLVLSWGKGSHSQPLPWLCIPDCWIYPEFTEASLEMPWMHAPRTWGSCTSSAGEFSSAIRCSDWHGDHRGLSTCENIFSCCKSCGRRPGQSCSILGAGRKEEQLHHEAVQFSLAVELCVSYRCPAQEQNSLSPHDTLHMEIESWVTSKGR